MALIHIVREPQKRANGAPAAYLRLTPILRRPATEGMITADRGNDYNARQPVRHRISDLTEAGCADLPPIAHYAPSPRADQAGARLYRCALASVPGSSTAVTQSPAVGRL